MWRSCYWWWVNCNAAMFLMKFTIIISFLFITQLFGQGYNCSAFVINKDVILLAKNLDWALGNGLIIYNPKGEGKKSVFAKESGDKWISKYSSITFNHLGLNQPLGGMNEAGLAVEELSTWPTEYSRNKEITVNEFEWIQYQLDNFSSVDECVANIGKYNIQKFFFNIHYMIVDSSGKSAVVEFINGKPVCYTNSLLPIQVLTNNNYHELIKYDQLFSKSHYDKLNVTNSQDRFLMINELLKNVKSYNSPLNYLDAIDILDSVKVSDTKWSVVYHILNKTIYFKTEEDEEIKNVRISDFYQTFGYKYFSLNSSSEVKFEKFTNNRNIDYLEILKKDILKQHSNIGAQLIDKISDYLN
jgi:penicillin V acylase-like amidase (Ntn superfamily)